MRGIRLEQRVLFCALSAGDIVLVDKSGVKFNAVNSCVRSTRWALSLKKAPVAGLGYGAFAERALRLESARVGRGRKRLGHPLVNSIDRQSEIAFVIALTNLLVAEVLEYEVRRLWVLFD